jgi:hypothetical protein
MGVTKYIHRRPKTFLATGRWKGGDPFTEDTTVRADFTMADGSTFSVIASKIAPTGTDEFRDFQLLVNTDAVALWPVGKAQMLLLRVDDGVLPGGADLVDVPDDPITFEVR